MPLLVGALSQALPGRAQTPPQEDRYAFSDTTLQRDTLGLTFQSLFPLADSLGMPPDTLRAISIRYRLTLVRLVHLSDSLHVPVDQVGELMLRERANPLAGRITRENSLHYTSSYNIAQTTSTWTNGADYRLAQGKYYVTNTTSIVMDRFLAGGVTSLRQVRSSGTEGGIRFSPDLSVGLRANLDRFDSDNPGSINNEAETKNEFQFSTRSKQRPSRGLASELNVFSGVLDLRNSSLVKRGFSADINGRARYQQGAWLVHDVTGRVSGNLALTRVPTAIERLNTRDQSTDLDGTLSLYPNAPLGLNVNYDVKRSRVETPLDSSRIQQVDTDNNSVNLTGHLRRDNDRYLNVSERLGNSRNATAASLTSTNTRQDQTFDVTGRYRLGGWTFDATFDNAFADSRFPQRSTTGGYGSKARNTSFQTSVTRTFWQRLTVRADGRVNLNSARYYVIGAYPTPPVDADQYRQSYRLEGLYNPSQKFSTRVALDVSRLELVNIPSTSTAANNETRTYRGEWSWTYQLLKGLTATQLNQLNSDYVYYTFLPANNRLGMDLRSLTTLNAVLTPRASIEITHDARTQPSGNYTPFPDGLSYFSQSDESRNYTLRARVTYTPSPAFALSVQTEYLANQRATFATGGEVPQRNGRTLNFTGGGNLNFPLGPHARFTGDIRRTYRADRTLTYQLGVPQPAPLSEYDFWNGRLELTWDM